MRLQYVSKYISLSEEGLVPKIECPMDQGPLMPNLTYDDEIYLYCLSCNYKQVVGIDYYGKIKSAVEQHTN